MAPGIGALVELHRVYGPVVRVHMASGQHAVRLALGRTEGTRQKGADPDSNRVADNTVCPEV